MERLDDEISDFIIRESRNITDIIRTIAQFQKKLEGDKFRTIKSESKDVAALLEIAHTLEISEQRVHNLDQKSVHGEIEEETFIRILTIRQDGSKKNGRSAASTLRTLRQVCNGE